MQRADEPPRVLEVAGASVALGEVRLEAGALGVGQRAVEVVGHELDELAADERIGRGGVATSASAARLHQWRECRAYAGACTMQQHALVDVAQLEQLADLLGGYAHEVAQRDHRPLGGREGVDGLEQMLAQLGREQAGLRVAVEPGGALVQRPSAAKAAGSTAGPSSLSSAENGTLRASRTAQVRARLTRMLKIQVRRDERPSKSSSPRDHGQPGLLDDLVGRRARAHERPRDAAQRPVVPVDERPEGILVSGPQTLEKAAIVVHRMPNLPRGRRTGHGSCAALRCRYRVAVGSAVTIVTIS